jgi:hypothetical protein
MEGGKIDTLTQIHERSLLCLDTGSSIKSGGIELVLLAKPFPLNEKIVKQNNLKVTPARPYRETRYRIAVLILYITA